MASTTAEVLQLNANGLARTGSATMMMQQVVRGDFCFVWFDFGLSRYLNIFALCPFSRLLEITKAMQYAAVVV